MTLGDNGNIMGNCQEDWKIIATSNLMFCQDKMRGICQEQEKMTGRCHEHEEMSCTRDDRKMSGTQEDD